MIRLALIYALAHSRGALPGLSGEDVPNLVET